jgi:hypothetical protein
MQADSDVLQYKMSRLDEELKTLRLRLAAVEEQKRVEMETAAEQAANPLKILEANLAQIRKSVEYHERHKRWQERNQAAGTVAYLTPIVEMLKRIEDRLDDLERRSTHSG